MVHSRAQKNRYKSSRMRSEMNQLQVESLPVFLSLEESKVLKLRWTSSWFSLF